MKAVSQMFSIRSHHGLGDLEARYLLNRSYVFVVYSHVGLGKGPAH